MIHRECKWIWLAAMIDGEGTIGIYKQNQSYAKRLIIVNTSEELIDYLVNNYKGSKHGPYKQKEENHKNRFWWRCDGKDAIKLIQKIEPYLVIKRVQAQLALEAWEDTFKIDYRGRKTPKYIADKREEYYQEMKKLNHRGKEEEEDEIEVTIKVKLPRNRTFIEYEEEEHGGEIEIKEVEET